MQGNNLRHGKKDIMRHYRLILDNAGQIINGRLVSNGNDQDYFAVKFMREEVQTNSKVVHPMIRVNDRKFKLTGEERRSSVITLPDVKMNKQNNTMTNVIKIPDIAGMTIGYSNVNNSSNSTEQTAYAYDTTTNVIADTVVTETSQQQSKDGEVEQRQQQQQQQQQQSLDEKTDVNFEDVLWVPSCVEWCVEVLSKQEKKSIDSTTQKFVKFKDFCNKIISFNMDMHSSEWETIYRDSKQFKHILSSKQNKTAFNALLVRETQKQSAATTLRTNMLIRTFNQILADVNNNILPWGVISFDT